MYLTVKEHSCSSAGKVVPQIEAKDLKIQEVFVCFTRAHKEERFHQGVSDDKAAGLGSEGHRKSQCELCIQ